MTNEPLVSICIPVLNGEHLIRHALESCIRQTYPNIEIIVGDDGSTDRTGEVVAEYAARDRRVTYIRNEKNLGMFGNWLMLFKVARGEYAEALSHDDWLSQNYVEECVRNFNHFPRTAAVYTTCESFLINDNDTFIFEREVAFASRTYAVDSIVHRMYRTDWGGLNLSAMVRRRDFIDAATAVLSLSRREDHSLDQRLLRLGATTDWLIFLKIIAKYKFLTFTDRCAYVRTRHLGNTGEQWRSDFHTSGAAGTFKLYDHFRACLEYVYATDFKKHLSAMRVFLGHEAANTALFNFMKSGMQRPYLHGMKEGIRSFFRAYSAREKAVVALSIPPTFVIRAVRFIVRKLKRPPADMYRAEFFLSDTRRFVQ